MRETVMTDKKLLNNVAKLGLPMLEPDEEFNVNETLAQVVKSRDARLWEGFPVLLANAANDQRFSLDRVDSMLQGKLKSHLHHLVMLSLAVYGTQKLTLSWANKLLRNLSNEDRALVKQWQDKLAHNEAVSWNYKKFDAQRLNNTFALYFEHSAEKARRLKNKYEEYSQEYALSQLFSPKQKELFKKKLEGLPLTKTEQEYFSRTVKKKVVALANSDLHALARKMLEQ